MKVAIVRKVEAMNENVRMADQKRGKLDEFRKTHAAFRRATAMPSTGAMWRASVVATKDNQRLVLSRDKQTEQPLTKLIKHITC